MSKKPNKGTRSKAVATRVQAAPTTLSFVGALVRGRLIPVTITFATLLFGIKIADIVRGTNELSEQFLASNAQAITPEEEAAAKAKEDAAKTEAEKPKEGEAAITEGEKPAEAEAAKAEGEKPAEGEAATAEGEKPAEGEAAKEGEAKDAKKADAKPAKPEKPEFSQVEVDILQSLSSRREELAKWEDDVKTKERLLDATEVRLDKKIEETKKLEATVRELLAEYNKQEDEKIKSLVKIYENMKPVDAARIFDELEMPILVLVVDKMNERKVAPVLANMKPERAKQLTIELAEDRKLRDNAEDVLNQGTK